MTIRDYDPDGYRASDRKAVMRRGRYAILREHGLSPTAASTACGSVYRTLAALPGVEFPPELVERRRTSPKHVYGPRDPASLNRAARYHALVALGADRFEASEGCVTATNYVRIARELWFRDG